MIGRRSLEDPRNQLVKEFVRVVAELDANRFVFENVKGLTLGTHRSFLVELIEAFEGVGYEVRLPWKVLDAASFGVPQHRERLILLGAKKGSRLPDYPDATHSAADQKRSIEVLPSGPTCMEALGDLPNVEDFPELFAGDAVRISSFGTPSKYARSLRGIGKEAWHFGYERNWDRRLLTSSARTVHTEISRRRFKETPPGNVEPISRFYRLPPRGLSNTLRAGTDGARGAFTSPRPIHYAHPRCVTVREMARLHGFPDWFRFHATKWHGARQIGNAVPPPLARAIGAKVIESLDIVPVRPEESISLGDPNLLYMEMSEAAAYFGVTAPTGRRDRKSGSKKRKQHEIEELRLAFQAAYA